MGKKSIRDDILDDIENYHRFHIFPHGRVINLSADLNLDEGGEHGVGFSMSLPFIKNINILESLSSEPITVILNTMGGDIIQGMAIYDAIRACKCHVTVIVRGACMSMGSVILQAADEGGRVLAPNSVVMFHHGDPGGASGSNTDEQVNDALFSQAYGKMCDKILYARINEKRTKDNQALMSYRTFETMTLKGKYLFAKDAIELGLADRIEDAGHEK